MKANELMIGDLIYLYGLENISLDPHWYVKNITADWLFDMVRSEEKDRYLVEHGVHIPDDMLFIGDTKPIPITEEILRANGWWNDEDMNDEITRFMFYRYQDYAITFESNGGLPVLTIEQDNLSDFRTKIQLVDEVYNVHELQHALRICGLNDLADNFKVTD